MKQQNLSPAEAAKLLNTLPPGAKIELKKLQGGQLSVTAQTQTKQQLMDQHFAHLVGQGISLSEAAKKYNVSRDLISKWVYRANYVGFVDEAAYPKLVDEAEVAVCAKIYHDRLNDPDLNRVPYFDDDGAVITELKHPALSEYRRTKAA